MPRVGWTAIHLCLGGTLVLAPLYLALETLRDEFSLGGLILCMLTWVVIPPLWLVVRTIQRRLEEKAGGARGFEVVSGPSAKAAEGVQPPQPHAPRGDERDA